MAEQPTRPATVTQIARGLVVSLIEWEIGAADGQRMGAACEKYGSERVHDALRSIARDLLRKGVAYMPDDEVERLYGVDHG